jgi:type IV fimbrial biogenesis protein FimT
MQRMRRQSGFTIAELLIVIAIIAVLAAVVIPGYLSYFPTYRLTSDVQELHGAVQLAKLRAIKENATVSLAVNTATNAYIVFVDNGAGGGTPDNGNRDGTEVLVKSETVSDGIDIYQTTFGGDVLQFNGRGLPSNPGSIRVKNSREQYRRIRVTIAGGATIQTSTDGGVNWQ